MSLPPGPRTPAVVQSLQLYRDPVGLLERGRDRYGPIFSLRLIGGERVAYVTSVELAREAFATDRTVGRAGEARKRFLEPLVGEHSLLTLDGEEWRRHHELLGPPLHGDRIKRFEGRIAALARSEVESWPSGTELEIQPRMQELTLEVILRVVFGISEGKRLAELRRLLPKLIAAGERYAWLPPGLRARLEGVARSRLWLPLNVAKRVLSLRDAVDELIYAEIASRRVEPELTERDDVLSEMLRARDEDGKPLRDVELRDELVTLLTAGHETTTTALAWAIDLLTHAPEADRALRESLATGSEELLDGAVREALRLRPVVFDVARTLSGPLEIGGYEVPAGWYIAPAIAALGRDPDCWELPDEFRPERYSEGRPNMRAWIPFGGGRRHCIGSQLALLEMRTILREILLAREIEPVSAEPEEMVVRHVTIQPRRGTRVITRPV